MVSFLHTSSTMPNTSKKDSTPFELSISSESSPGSSTTPSSMTLPWVRPLSFPTVSELANDIDVAGKKSSKRPDNERLYQVLIGAPQALFSDLLDCPTRYEPGVSELLQELLGGRKSYSSLDEESKDLLDRATIEFNQARRPRPEPIKTQPKPKAEESEDILELGEKDFLAVQEPTNPPVIDGLLQPYWWLK